LALSKRRLRLVLVAEVLKDEELQGDEHSGDNDTHE
jgi:hypothetical protein